MGLVMESSSRSRFLLALGSLVRLAVGMGYLFAPERVAGRLAPDISGSPDGRMSLRGFGALHCGVAAGSLYGAVRGEATRALAVLNLACAIGDTTATLLERRDRGAWEPSVLGSVPIDVGDVMWWLNVLRISPPAASVGGLSSDRG